MQCPKCRYVRKLHDAHVMEGICPSCGIAYIKWLEKLERERLERETRERGNLEREKFERESLEREGLERERPGRDAATGAAATGTASMTQAAALETLPAAGDRRSSGDRWQVSTETPRAAGDRPSWDADGEGESVWTWRQYFIHFFLFVPSNRHESAFWGHALIYVLFLFWGWSFILGGIDWIAINDSFLHNANLAFHEFGHVAFSPFGPFMAILGGSLFQILLPLALLLVFAIRQRDNFAASLMLWWCGQNFIDVSPYVADARDRIMPLIGGLGVESHDWGNLLRMTDTLEYTEFLAGLFFTTGALLILLSNAWGAALLYIELRGRGVVEGEVL